MSEQFPTLGQNNEKPQLTEKALQQIDAIIDRCPTSEALQLYIDSIGEERDEYFGECREYVDVHIPEMTRELEDLKAAAITARNKGQERQGVIDELKSALGRLEQEEKERRTREAAQRIVSGRKSLQAQLRAQTGEQTLIPSQDDEYDDEVTETTTPPYTPPRTATPARGMAAVDADAQPATTVPRRSFADMQQGLRSQKSGGSTNADKLDEKSGDRSSLSLRERWSEATRPKKIAGLAGAVLALGGAGYLSVDAYMGSNSDKPSRIAQGAEFGAGFDEEGRSDTARPVGDIDLEAYIAFHEGVNEDGDTLSFRKLINDENQIDANAEPTYPKMQIEGATIFGDVVDSGEPTAVTIDEYEGGEYDRVATLNLSELQTEISIRNQEDTFYSLSITDEEYKMSEEMKTALYDGAEAVSNDQATKETVDEFIRNVETPELHEQISYEAVSMIGEKIVTPEVVEGSEVESDHSKVINAQLKERAINDLEDYLEERDPNHTYIIETEGELDPVTLKVPVLQSKEDGAGFGVIKDADGREVTVPSLNINVPAGTEEAEE